MLKILKDETELLEESEEPFQILANGHIGAALFAALRVLCSGAEDKKLAVKSLDDALTTPRGEIVDPGTIGAVQVGGYTTPDSDNKIDILSKRDQDDKVAKTSDGCCHHDHCNGNHHSEDFSTHDSVLASMVTPSMRTVLEKTAKLRLERYPTSLEDTVEELKQLEGGFMNDGCSALDEGQSAMRAALSLRASEQEVVYGLLTALQIASK